MHSLSLSRNQVFSFCKGYRLINTYTILFSFLWVNFYCFNFQCLLWKYLDSLRVHTGQSTGNWATESQKTLKKKWKPECGWGWYCCVFKQWHWVLYDLMRTHRCSRLVIKLQVLVFKQYLHEFLHCVDPTGICNPSYAPMMFCFNEWWEEHCLGMSLLPTLLNVEWFSLSTKFCF